MRNKWIENILAMESRLWTKGWRENEQDERLARANMLHECTVERDGVFCGYPLDDNGLCPEHE